jgi:DUF971 family protein
MTGSKTFGYGPVSAPAMMWEHSLSPRSSTLMNENEIPEAIVDHQATGTLELTWSDGSTTRLAHSLLRLACKCSGCEHQFRLSGVRVEAPAHIRIEDIRPIGDKGLNFLFSDGHNRGIYPWSYLRQIPIEYGVAVRPEAG